MTDNGTPALAAALGIDGGIVCAVGAGGKKSLLYALAREAAGRVGVTATVMMLRFPRRLGARVMVDDEAVLQQALARPGGAGVHAYACPSEKSGRMAGLSPATVDVIHADGGFDVTLVKADGARMRGIKAPKPGEPVLPGTTSRVLPVISARVIGEALNARTAHRPELVSQVTGAEPEAPLTPQHIARLLASEHGALQGTAGMQIVPVINQVDDGELGDRAREAARIALNLSDRYDRIVLTCLRREHPVVETVRNVQELVGTKGT